MIERIHHIGIAVRDLAEAVTSYQDRFGLIAEHVDPPPGSDLRFAVVRLGGADIELIAESATTTPISKFLRERGPGLHHIAFEVDDIRLAMASSGERGLRALSAEPQPGIEGHLTCFFHPRETLGTLVEYVEEGPVGE